MLKIEGKTKNNKIFIICSFKKLFLALIFMPFLQFAPAPIAAKEVNIGLLQQASTPVLQLNFSL